MGIARNNHMSRLDNVPAELCEQAFEEFFKVAEIARMSPAGRAIYEENRKRYLDFTNSMTSVEERAWNEAESRQRRISFG